MTVHENSKAKQSILSGMY